MELRATRSLIQEVPELQTLERVLPSPPKSYSISSQHEKSLYQSQQSSTFNDQTSNVTELIYIPDTFSFQEVVLLTLYSVNTLMYFYYSTNLPKVIALQLVFTTINGLIVIKKGVTKETLPFLIVVIATIFALLYSLFIPETRQFMLIPAIYPLGVVGVRNKIFSTWRAIRKESIWMFLSIALLLYFFGFIGYAIFWRNTEYFDTPIQASATLLQISTFDSIGRIISRVSATSGLVATVGVLLTTVIIFQILYNINQAVILQFVYSKEKRMLDKAFQRTFESLGIDIQISGNMFRRINIVSTSVVFLIPFQTNLNWFYFLMSLISTISVVAFEYYSQTLFSLTSIANVTLQTLILFTVAADLPFMTFLVCCFRIVLIREVINFWTKAQRVLANVYPMLSLIIAFYVMFAMLIFCLQRENWENTFITGFQMLTLDDWSTHLRSYPWYMKVILLLYLVVGSHLLLNSLVSQAFNELQDQKIQSADSIRSNSLAQTIHDLPAQKKFTAILHELEFQIPNVFYNKSM